MFCFQCEQTAKGIGCDKGGVCGKSPEVAVLQDLLIHAVKGLAVVANDARKKGVVSDAADDFTCKAVFSTLTNVNFDPDRFVSLIREAGKLRDELKAKLPGGAWEFSGANESFDLEKDQLVARGRQVGVKADPDMNEDVLSLRELLIYGLKGLCAYADHARILGQTDEAVYAFVHEALAATTAPNLDADTLTGLVFKCGEVNLTVMALLDTANTGAYGHPVPTGVPLGHKKGKAILVSGHDLKCLDEILKQTEGKGIFVYTHGEMLPCHGYPELKKYPHFYGHYGTAWQNQKKEFAAFPGAILMTTNCIQKPAGSYQDNIFTTELVGYPGVTHVPDYQYGPVIEKALEMDGFAAR